MTPHLDGDTTTSTCWSNRRRDGLRISVQLDVHPGKLLVRSPAPTSTMIGHKTREEKSDSAHVATKTRNEEAWSNRGETENPPEGTLVGSFVRRTQTPCDAERMQTTRS